MLEKTLAMSALLLALGACTQPTATTDGAVVDAMPDDAGPADDASLVEPAACTAAPARPLGQTTAPLGALQIVHTPEGELMEGATVTSIELASDPMVIVVDIGGISHRIEVPEHRGVPSIAPGDSVWIELMGTWDRSPNTSLVIRAADGVTPIAAYVRSSGNGFGRAAPFIASTFGIALSQQAFCRVPTGGQCGRGVIVRQLVSGAAHATEGETMIVPRTGAPAVGISVDALSDDNDTWAAGEVCAIGPLVAEAVDAVVEPPGD